MPHIFFHSLASLSLVVFPLTEDTGGRPSYGGTLRVKVSTAVSSLEPRDWGRETLASSDAQRLAGLFAETLVGLDELGRLRPILAISWEANAPRTVWTLRLRPGVQFHDGSPLTAAAVARSLGRSEGLWQVTVSGDSVVIRTQGASPDLPMSLTRLHHAITFRAQGGSTVATGPFRVFTLGARHSSGFLRP